MLRRVGVCVTVLGSGSGGNCTLIESATTRILVDAGLSGRQISDRLATIGRSLAEINGIILTHEHGDHTRGLAPLCKSHAIPVYANRLTAEAVNGDAQVTGKSRVSWRLFATGSPFEIGDWQVESFSVPHDAYDPVGYVITQASSGVRVGVLTDLGQPTKLIIARLRDTDILVVEANHDVKMLQDDTARPWATKQRIMSRHGHLSNEAAAQLAGEVVSDRLRHLFLAHLSQDCNRPELARDVVHAQLDKRGARQIAIHVASQNVPTSTAAV